MTSKYIKRFPKGFQNGQIIGTSQAGELVAIGVLNGEAWSARFSRHLDIWITTGPATREQIGAYDEIFLETMKITLDESENK